MNIYLGLFVEKENERMSELKLLFFNKVFFYFVIRKSMLKEIKSFVLF